LYNAKLIEANMCTIFYCVVFVFLALANGNLYIGRGRVDFFNPFINRVPVPLMT